MRQLTAARVGFGSKPESLKVSISFPVCLQKQTYVKGCSKVRRKGHAVIKLCASEWIGGELYSESG
jgi:hypothetical protein